MVDIRIMHQIQFSTKSCAHLLNLLKNKVKAEFVLHL